MAGSNRNKKKSFNLNSEVFYYSCYAFAKGGRQGKKKDLICASLANEKPIYNAKCRNNWN